MAYLIDYRDGLGAATLPAGPVLTAADKAAIRASFSSHGVNADSFVGNLTSMFQKGVPGRPDHVALSPANAAARAWEYARLAAAGGWGKLGGTYYDNPEGVTSNDWPALLGVTGRPDMDHHAMHRWNTVSVWQKNFPFHLITRHIYLADMDARGALAQEYVVAKAAQDAVDREKAKPWYKKATKVVRKVAAVAVSGATLGTVKVYKGSLTAKEKQNLAKVAKVQRVVAGTIAGVVAAPVVLGGLVTGAGLVAGGASAAAGAVGSAGSALLAAGTRLATKLGVGFNKGGGLQKLAALAGSLKKKSPELSAEGAIAQARDVMERQIVATGEPAPTPEESAAIENALYTEQQAVAAAAQPAPDTAALRYEQERRDRLDRQERQERVDRQERQDRLDRQERLDRAMAQPAAVQPGYPAPARAGLDMGIPKEYIMYAVAGTVGLAVVSALTRSKGG